MTVKCFTYTQHDDTGTKEQMIMVGILPDGRRISVSPASRDILRMNIIKELERQGEEVPAMIQFREIKQP